jgi:hypothetical protein
MVVYGWMDDVCMGIEEMGHRCRVWTGLKNKVTIAKCMYLWDC